MLFDDPARWINSRHLSDEAINRYAAQFAADPHATLWLDDFLLSPKLSALRSLFVADGDFQPIYGLYGGKREARREGTQEEWEQAAPEKRFDHELLYAGPRRGAEMGAGAVHHMIFRNMVGSSAFLALLRRIIGYDPGGAQGMQTRITCRGHVVGLHSDAAQGRRLCTVLYLSEGWRPEFGGRLRQYRPDQPSRSLEPLENRFVLFRPYPEAKHDVEPLTAAAAEWRRYAITTWHGEADALSDGGAAQGRI